MRPNSSGGPGICSRSGRMVEALTVSRRKRSGAPARTVPVRLGHWLRHPRHQHAGDAVVGAHAVEIVPDDRDAIRLARPGSPDAVRRSSPLRGEMADRAVDPSSRDPRVSSHQKYSRRQWLKAIIRLPSRQTDDV